MTNIKIIKKDGQIIGFECSGHTGYALAGKDIVCAGISTLSLTCALALEKVAHLKPVATQDDEKGYLKVLISQTNTSSQVIFETFLTGVRELEKEYKKYIKLEEENGI